MRSRDNYYTKLRQRESSKVIITSRSRHLFTFLAWMDTAQQTDLLRLPLSLSVHSIACRSRSNHWQFDADERGEQKR